MELGGGALENVLQSSLGYTLRDSLGAVVQVLLTTASTGTRSRPRTW